MTSLIRVKKRLKRPGLPYVGMASKVLSPSDIFLEVCGVMDIPPEDVCSRKRFKHLVKARAVYALIAREMGFTLDEIGKEMNRDYSSVIHHLNQYKAFLDESEPWFRPNLKADIDNIKHRLKVRGIYC